MPVGLRNNNVVFLMQYSLKENLNYGKINGLKSKNLNIRLPRSVPKDLFSFPGTHFRLNPDIIIVTLPAYCKL